MRQINTIFIVGDRDIDAQELTDILTEHCKVLSVSYDGNGDQRGFYSELEAVLDGPATVFIAGDNAANDLTLEIAREYGLCYIYYIPAYGAELPSARGSKQQLVAAFANRHQHSKINHKVDVNELAREILRLSDKIVL